MSALTREAIHAINEHYRLGDAADEAHFYGRDEEDAELEAQSKAFRAKFTDDDLYAYLNAGIRPPHVVGQADHDAMVRETFPNLGQ
ncbi:hypothetical protein OG874_00325 [Nocardia sp. NBC_00565]|uniref:hypothetical protein n=1 Tax=Nocardia sp. NBC_00565 TaxID=2975993 RepID=UPI002E803EC8|nr:hypothetical protein [Nocardia sp. NBC_00565]WUC03700.1 hypothetical protein OG874_00325 [Nocardia sp. NBC_00565]